MKFCVARCLGTSCFNPRSRVRSDLKQEEANLQGVDRFNPRSRVRSDIMAASW